MNAQGSPAPRAGHLGDVAVREAARVCIDPMQFDRRFRAMTSETRRFSGTGHGVPLIAHPAGVQQQRSPSRSGMHGPARRNRDEARATIGMKEAAFGEEASTARAVRSSRRPVHAATAGRPLLLNTGRVRDQWHTMTRTGKSARLAGHRPEPTIELHRIDAAARNLTDGDIAEVTSMWGRAALRVHVTDALRPGDTFAAMHWTAQVSRAGRINAAVNPAVDPISGQPELKHTPIEVRRLPILWHGTILARRPVMLPEVSYWVRIRGAGYHAWLLAGEQPLETARQALSAAVRATNPGPWLEGEDGIAAVLSDGRLEAVLALGEMRDEAVRNRLAPFMAIDRLGVEQRNLLLHGGDAADRGGEICACFGVSCAAVETAIADGAATLDAVGAMTRAGTNCGSCRPEIRALVRTARPRKAAGKAAQKAA